MNLLSSPLPRFCVFFVWLMVFSAPLVFAAETDVVINEILYNPTEDCFAGEYVELYNRGTESVDLGNWFLSGGVTYTFPEGTQIRPNTYLLIAEDSAVLRGKYTTLGTATVLGPYVGQLSNEGESVELLNSKLKKIDEVQWNGRFPWPVAADGEGASLELIHPSLDNARAGSWNASLQPSPGRRNSVYTLTPPPAIQAAQYLPKQPKGDEPVVVSAYLLDAPTLSEVKVEYQVVKPGAYIRITDATFQTQWTALDAKDDGVEPDQNASDGIFTARIPGQEHRDLVRYRIRAKNQQGGETVAPRQTDPSPNFAYYVYDGVPPYKVTKPVAREHTVLDKIPVYHLISHPNDIRDCETNQSVNRRDFKWEGAFVYNGEVYDHIHYRLRGGTWRYLYKKRFWKIRFNQGQYFQGNFNNGEPYAVPRKTLNLNAPSQNPNLPVRSGESGFFETTGFWLFRQAETLAPYTTFIHFRVVDNASETGADQTKGDFYGIFTDVEQPDSRFLEARGYPENSNWYKMNRGWTGTNKIWEKETNNCDPADDSDIAAFYTGYNSKRTSYLEQNLDLERYYSYRSVMEAIHHYDVYAEKNYYYINNGESGLWEVTPWDIDLTFGSDHGDGSEPFRNMLIGQLPNQRAKYSTPYQNRLREVVQLLYNEQALFPIMDEWYQLIKEVAAADYDRWYQSPPDRSTYKSLPDRVTEMKGWINNRLRNALPPLMRDVNPESGRTNLPDTPSVQPPDSDGMLQPGKVTFTATPFEDPNQDAHIASRWIITREGGVELSPDWDSGETQEFKENIPVDLSLLQPGQYRMRARYLNSTGRWSYWSEPYTFTLTEPVGVGNWELH